jgi:bifunctional non-homologous end joining protein LigD
MRWTSSRKVTPAAGFIQPCIPTVAPKVPSGESWIFEVKWDGCRLLVRKRTDVVRVYTRRGADWTKRFPRVVAAVRKLKAESALIDGEAIVYNKGGMPSFDLLHSREYDEEASFVAFDLLELDDADTRKLPLLDRKARQKRLLAKAPDGIEFNGHFEGDGTTIFKHVCKLGHEGIVAKRKDLAYESGRSRRRLKIKNPESPAALYSGKSRKHFEDKLVTVMVANGGKTIFRIPKP